MLAPLDVLLSARDEMIDTPLCRDAVPLENGVAILLPLTLRRQAVLIFIFHFQATRAHNIARIAYYYFSRAVQARFNHRSRHG